jgi:hypothetical protein
VGDPHNPARYGEMWNPHRVAVLRQEIEATREFGILSGGWAWHFMSPPHEEEKHLHDHRDIDLHVIPHLFSSLVETLTKRGYARGRTRFDDPSGEFVRFERVVLDACSSCHAQGVVEEGIETECLACGHREPASSVENVKVIFDLFVQEVPWIEVDGYRVVEPKKMLTFYGVKHSSEQCVAVVAARGLVEAGQEIVKNAALVGAWGVPR